MLVMWQDFGKGKVVGATGLVIVPSAVPILMTRAYKSKRPWLTLNGVTARIVKTNYRENKTIE
jgi:hypothetical protein